MSKPVPSAELLEREDLFEQARRFPLLAADEERAVDARKWAAAEALQACFAGDPAATRYLETWLHCCASCPPRIAEIRPRRHYYLLRREMAEFLNGSSAASQRGAGDKPAPEIPATVATRRLAPSLAAGLAAVMLRHDGGAVSCNIADAINVWEQLWDREAWPPELALSRASSRQLRRHRRAYLRARDTLVMHNLRLVYTIAGKYRGKGVSFPDLVQEATLGLIRASEKYDAAKGYRFSTYAFNWITQAVRRAVANDGGIIRYPSHVQEKVNKLYRLRSETVAGSGVEPGVPELARMAGLSLADTRAVLKLRNQAQSLDAPRTADNDGNLHDLLPAANSGDTVAGAETGSLHRHLLEQLQASLDPVERDVIIARWGLHGSRPLTRSEMATHLHLSSERVRQLEQAALDKLQHNPDLRSTFEVYRSVPDDH